MSMVLLTFLLKCCVMTQQEGIIQDVYTFARIARVWPIKPPHDKTNKMACAPSEDSDQPLLVLS